MTSGTDSQPDQEAIRQRLVESMGEQLEFALVSQEFAAYRNSRNELRTELLNLLDLAFTEFSDELSTILRIEQERERSESARRRQVRYFWSALSLPFLAILCLLVSIPLRYYKVVVPLTLHFRTLSSVIGTEIGIAVFGLFAIGILSAVAEEGLPAARREYALTVDRGRVVRRYKARLEIFVTEQMRLIIPGLPEPVTKVAFLEYSSALVELALAEPISTTALTSVRRFVESHTASALGLSGPRGIGKTTILNFLISMNGTLGVYIPAPVRYEPDELLKRISEELANKCLGKGWEHSSANDSSRPNLRLLISGYLLLIALVGGIALYVFDPRLKISLARWLAILIVLSGVVFTAFLVRQYFDFRRVGLRRDQESSLAERAESILRNFRWAQQRTSNLGLETKPWGGLLRITSEKSATTTERDIGRPRLIADLQDFIRMISESKGFDRIIIAIDELDKLASADDLIAVINEIKDILHIEGTHVIVSVSRDALHRFLLRGLPSRDVFDSAFDEIIEVPMLDASESVEVLQKRAVGFPASWGFACYILSGGLPRDLLRYGRRCVEIYRLTDDRIANVPTRLLGELAAEKVLAELQARGTVSRLTRRGWDELESALNAAKQGSISAIVQLENEIYKEPFSPIREWLEWLTEVMDFLQSGGANNASGMPRPWRAWSRGSQPELVVTDAKR